MRLTILLKKKLCSFLQSWTSRCNKKSVNNQAFQKQSMIWLPSQISSDATWIVSPNHPCQRILVLHFLLLLNLGEVMLLLPTLRTKTAAEKRFFALMVKKKATKRRNVRRNPAMLSNTQKPGLIQLEHKLLQ